MAKIKEKSQAEINYDQENPPLSNRISRVAYDTFKKLSEETGLDSRALLETFILGDQEYLNNTVEKKVNEKLQIIHDAAVAEGKELGRTEAETSVQLQSKKISDELKTILRQLGFDSCVERHAVVVVCAYCNQQIILPNNMQEIKDFQQWMQNKGFLHPECHKKWLFQTGQITWESLAGLPEQSKEKNYQVRVGQGTVPML